MAKSSKSPKSKSKNLNPEASDGGAAHDPLADHMSLTLWLHQLDTPTLESLLQLLERSPSLGVLTLDQVGGAVKQCAQLGRPTASEPPAPVQAPAPVATPEALTLPAIALPAKPAAPKHGAAPPKRSRSGRDVLPAPDPQVTAALTAHLQGSTNGVMQATLRSAYPQVHKDLIRASLEQLAGQGLVQKSGQRNAVQWRWIGARNG